MDVYKGVSDDCFSHSKFLLSIFGLRDNKNILYRFYAVCLLLLITTYPLLVIPEIMKIHDFDEFVQSVLYNIAQITGLTIPLGDFPPHFKTYFWSSPPFAVISTYYIHWNRLKLQSVFEKMENLNGLSICDNGIDGYEFMKKYNNWIRKQSYIGSILILAALLTVTLMSLVLSINKEEWILPFGCGLDLNNNNIKYITNILINIIVGNLLFSHIFMYANMLTFICGHCKLFQKYLSSIMAFRDNNSLPENQNQNQISNNLQTSNNTNDIIDWKTFKLKLRKLIPYHVGIYETGAEIENTLCMVVLVWFGGLSICACLFIFHITTVNIISDMGISDILGVLILNLAMFILCAWGEQVISESCKIANVCYELDFVGADLRIQKSLLIIMIRSQKPIVPTIGKFKMLCLSTMVGILQSTYSYYAILQNLKNK